MIYQRVRKFSRPKTVKGLNIGVVVNEGKNVESKVIKKFTVPV